MVKAPQGWTNMLQKVLAIGMIGTVFLLASVRLSSENQLVLCTGMLMLLCVAGWLRKAQPAWSRVGVIVIGTYVTLRYWVFRTTETIGYQSGWDFTFLILLYLAETYCIGTYVISMFGNIAALTRRFRPCRATLSGFRRWTSSFRLTTKTWMSFTSRPRPARNWTTRRKS